jgi:hypothetical protein
MTAIAWNTAPVQLGVNAVSVLADEEDGWHRAAALVTLDETSFVALFAAPHEGAAAHRSMHRVSIPHGQLATDARVAILRLSHSGEPLSIAAIGGRSVEWRGQGGFRTSPTKEPTDLHLDAAALDSYRSVASGETRQHQMAMNSVRRVG